jgi:hypothetical protein
MTAIAITRRRRLTQAQRDANIARVANLAAERTLSHLTVVNQLHGLLDDDEVFDELRKGLAEVVREHLHKAEIRALVRAGR